MIDNDPSLLNTEVELCVDHTFDDGSTLSAGQRGRLVDVEWLFADVEVDGEIYGFTRDELQPCKN